MSLIELLPEYYQNSEEVKRLQDAISHWSELIEIDTEEILLQLNVNTATWGLAYWEKQYGIITDITKSVELRRERIKAKMSGIGTFNKTIVQNFINTIDHGAADIIEYPNDFTFAIKFKDYYQVPTELSIQELKEYTEKIKPAHLAYYHTYTYNWWGMQDNGIWNDGGTWDDLRNYKEV